jgi:hypothetical protein
MKQILCVIAVLSVPLTLFAGPYRVLAFKFRAFGGIGLGFITWIGIALVFPACIAAFSNVDSWWIAWAFLATCAYIQMFVQWCSKAPRRDPASPHCWLGWGEPLLAVALSIAASAACGPGGMAFFLTGYACSTADWLLCRLRRRLLAWTPADTARSLAPAYAAAARLQALARAGAQWAAWASPICARFTFRYGLILASGAALLLRGAWSVLAARAQQPALAQGPSVRSPGFVSRVASFVVGHMIFSLLTGALGFWGLAKGIGLILSIPAALILWVCGGRPDLPHFAKEDARSVISRVKEGLEDKKEDAIERLRLKREAMQERWQDNKEEISDEIGRRKRRAVWNLFTK